METEKKQKSGSRNSEKRRERSKVAARCRRGKESEIFSELASCLPLSDQARNSLDKASIARLAVTFLKMKDMMADVIGSLPGNILNKNSEFDSFLNQAMGGFAFVLSADGDLVFVSESVTKCLGLAQFEVMGQSVYDFTHPCDHMDIKNMLVLSRNAPKDQPIPRSGFFRMKCTITSKGRNVHLRAASYKGISCTGRLFIDGKDPSNRWYVGVGEPLADPKDVNFPLNKQAFVTRHSMDMKCEDVSGNVEEFMGYKSEDLIGKSFYDFYHAGDGGILANNIKGLYAKGQIQTERYRFLARNGGWVWCVTQATVLKPDNGSKPSGIVCLNFITSGIENEHEILSEIQKKATTTDLSTINDTILLPDILASATLSNPTPSTTKIFAPRTEDMDSGFLMPCDNTLIGSKDEPDDLTHLAPIAGDECVPLYVPLLDDLLRSFDQANFEYVTNGFFVDLDTDQIPLLVEPSKIDEHPLLSEARISLKENEIPSPSSPFPLFLNSDPHMGSKLSIFPSAAFPDENLVDESGDEGFNDLCGMDSLTAFEDELTIDGKMSSKLPDELSEFRAPFVPMDSEENIPLVYSDGNLIWPAEPIITSEMDNSTIGTSSGKSHSKFSDKNIDQITCSLHDVESILAARKPGDQPKVVTRSIFGVTDSPPLKLRKLAVVYGSPRVSVISAEPVSVGSKCPFLQTRELPERGRLTKLEQLNNNCMQNSIRKRNLSGFLLNRNEIGRLPTFYELTQQDYEKMLPLSDTSLLEGSELLSALESVLDSNCNDLIPISNI